MSSYVWCVGLVYLVSGVDVGCCDDSNWCGCLWFDKFYWFCCVVYGVQDCWWVLLLVDVCFGFDGCVVVGYC